MHDLIEDTILKPFENLLKFLNTCANLFKFVNIFLKVFVEYFLLNVPPTLQSEILATVYFIVC